MNLRIIKINPRLDQILWIKRRRSIFIVVVIVVNQLNEVFEHNSGQVFVASLGGIDETLSRAKEKFASCFIFRKWVWGYSLVIKALLKAQNKYDR